MGRTKLTWAVTVLACAALAQTPAEHFAAKRYAEYLGALATELDARRPPLTKIGSVAIALDRTQGWETATGKRAAELVQGDAVASRNLGALRRLLGADAAAVGAFIQADPPPVAEVRALGPMLSQHGYPVASAAVRALNLLMGYGVPMMMDQAGTEDALKALASLPATEADKVVALLRPRLAAIPMKLTMVAEAARASGGRATGEEAQRLLALAKAFSPPRQVTLAMAAQLSYAGRGTEGVELAVEALRAGDTNVDELVPALGQGQWQAPREVSRECYREALARIPEPHVRWVRALYLRWLNASGPPEDLDAAVRALGPLAEADMRWLLQRGADAASKYAAVYRAPDQSAGVRLDAWGGWLESDPLAALASQPQPLLDTPALRRWATKACYRAAMGRFRPGPTGLGSPLPDAKEAWSALATKLCEILGAEADTVIATPADGSGRDCRIEVGTVWLLAGREEEAIRCWRQAERHRIGRILDEARVALRASGRGVDEVSRIEREVRQAPR